MSPLEKPEWIELADRDNAASIRKISKKLPVIALVAAAAIIGVGAVLGQTAQESPAQATESVAQVPAVSSAQKSGSSATVAPKATSATPRVKTPTIGTLPTKRGEHEDPDHENEGDDD
jgi:hypothetical protein